VIGEVGGAGGAYSSSSQEIRPANGMVKHLLTSTRFISFNHSLFPMKRPYRHGLL